MLISINDFHIQFLSSLHEENAKIKQNSENFIWSRLFGIQIFPLFSGFGQQAIPSIWLIEFQFNEWNTIMDDFPASQWSLNGHSADRNTLSRSMENISLFTPPSPFSYHANDFNCINIFFYHISFPLFHDNFSRIWCDTVQNSQKKMKHIKTQFRTNVSGNCDEIFICWFSMCIYIKGYTFIQKKIQGNKKLEKLNGYLKNEGC